MFVLIFSTNFVSNFSNSKNNSARYYLEVHRSSCKVPVIRTRYQLKISFLGGFSQKHQMSNLMKIRPWNLSCSLATGQTDWRTDGETDMMKLVVVFCNFAKAPNKDWLFVGYGTVSRASGTDVSKNSIAFFFFFFKGKAVERECVTLKHCKKLVWPLRSFAVTLPQRTLSQKTNFIARLSVPAHMRVCTYAHGVRRSSLRASREVTFNHSGPVMRHFHSLHYPLGCNSQMTVTAAVMRPYGTASCALNSRDWRISAIWITMTKTYKNIQKARIYYKSILLAPVH